MAEDASAGYGGAGNTSGIGGMDVSKSGELFLFCLLTPGNYSSGAVSITTKKYYVLKYNKDGFYQSKSDLDITVSGNASNGFGFATLGLDLLPGSAGTTGTAGITSSGSTITAMATSLSEPPL